VQKKIEEALKQKLKKSQYGKMIVAPITDNEVPELCEVDQCLRNELIETVYNVAIDEEQASTSESAVQFGPSLASLGIKKQFMDPGYFDSNEKAYDNGDLDLSGIDDGEIDSYILNDIESTIKSRVWLARNGEHLIEAEKKRKLREDEEEKFKDNPKKKRRCVRKKEEQNHATHSDAMYQVIQEKKLSNKINWDIIDQMDNP